MAERDPRFIDDEQAWLAVEPAFHAVEQVEEDRDDNPVPHGHQLLDLEGLEGVERERIGLAVEERPERALHRVGLNRLPQLLGLQGGPEVREGLRGLGLARDGQRTLDLVAQLGRQRDVLELDEGRDPLGRPRLVGVGLMLPSGQKARLPSAPPMS